MGVFEYSICMSVPDDTACFSLRLISCETELLLTNKGNSPLRKALCLVKGISMQKVC